MPNVIAFSCHWTACGVGDLSLKVRKNPTMPNPNVNMVSVVRIQASGVATDHDASATAIRFSLAALTRAL